MPAEDELRTVEEQAAYLKVPVQTLYQWNHKRIGPPVIKMGRALRYSARATEQWLAERTAKTSVA